MNIPIQGLWIGPELSVLERLSITSFLRNGHAYHLYIYDEVQHIPAGTYVMDANKILPASMIFQYRDFPSYAGFANLFRYKLLFEKGGWWVDTDTVCLKAFDFPEAYVFAAERDGLGGQCPTSGVIKVPAASEIMQYAWDTCQHKDPHQLEWGETGPRLIAQAVHEYGLEDYIQPDSTFCPIPGYDWKKLLDAQSSWPFAATTYSIHCWNELWRRSDQDKNAAYHPDCLYEQLKTRYNVIYKNA